MLRALFSNWTAILLILLYLPHAVVSEKNIIDDLLWDKEILRKLQQQVDANQQTDPYALRYYQWLKQREGFEKQKEKDREREKIQKQQEKQEKQKREAMKKAKAEHQAQAQKQPIQKQPKPKSQEKPNEAPIQAQDARDVEHREPPSPQQQQLPIKNEEPQGESVDRHSNQESTDNDATVKTIQEAVLEQLEQHPGGQKQRIVVVTIPDKLEFSGDAPNGKGQPDSEHPHSEKQVKASTEAVAKKGKPQGEWQRGIDPRIIASPKIPPRQKEAEHQQDDVPQNLPGTGTGASKFRLPARREN